MTAVRANPSGKLVQPLPSKGPFAWDATSPLVLELLSIGHLPGIYEIVQTYFVRVTPSALSALGSISWNQPRFGATQLDINYGSVVVTPNVNFGALRTIESSGLAPVLLTLTPSGLSGTASLEIACLAQREAFPFL